MLGKALRQGDLGEVSMGISAVTLEVLHGPLVSFCGFA
jgi:hypothetical protein